MLQKRSRAVHVENLQPVTDSENRLAVFVGILEQQYHRLIPRQVGVGRLGIACRTILLRQHIRPAARKQNRGTAVDQLLQFGTRDVQRDRQRFASGQINRPHVLRQSAAGIVRDRPSGEPGWQYVDASPLIVAGVRLAQKRRR